MGILDDAREQVHCNTTNGSAFDDDVYYFGVLIILVRVVGANTSKRGQSKIMVWRPHLFACTESGAVPINKFTIEVTNDNSCPSIKRR